MSYPEHEKLRGLAGKNQTCGEFLEWLQQRYTIAEYHTHSVNCLDDGGYPVCGSSEKSLYTASLNIPKLLAEFFEIDESKLEQEKVAMLDDLRKAQKR